MARDRFGKNARGALGFALVLLLTSACSDNASTPTTASGGGASSGGSDQTARGNGGKDPVQVGFETYRQTCSACHNLDPSLDGPLGPAITGSSRELLEARVIRGEYPPGYKPKRETKAMVAMPHLEPKLDALYAYLNQ